MQSCASARFAAWSVRLADRAWTGTRRRHGWRRGRYRCRCCAQDRRRGCAAASVLHPGDPGVPHRDWSATGCCRGYRDFCVLRCARASFVFPCLIIELCHFLWWIGYGRGEPPPRAARPATGVGTLPAPRAAEPPPEAVRAVRVAYRRRGAALTVPGRDRAGRRGVDRDACGRAAACCVLLCALNTEQKVE